MITPTSKPLRTTPNSYSLSRTAKNDGCCSRKIESTIATGVMAIDEIDKERGPKWSGLKCIQALN
jgi:hypothetical protein